MKAVRYGHPIIMIMLFTESLDVNHKNNNGTTVFTYPACNVLLAAGAQPTGEQFRQLNRDQQAIIKKRHESVRAWLLSLEENYNLPRDLSRLIADFTQLPAKEKLSRHGEASKDKHRVLSSLMHWAFVPFIKFIAQ